MCMCSTYMYKVIFFILLFLNCLKKFCFSELFFRGKGNKKAKKAAFRECFFRIGDLRSLLPQDTPFLALTATATDEIIRETVKGLSMKSNVHHISVSPDHLNIYLFKFKVNKALTSTLGVNWGISRSTFRLRCLLVGLTISEAPFRF